MRALFENIGQGVDTKILLAGNPSVTVEWGYFEQKTSFVRCFLTIHIYGIMYNKVKLKNTFVENEMANSTTFVPS